MKIVANFLFAVAAIACISLFSGCSKESSLMAQYNTVRNDPYYKAYLTSVNSLNINSINGYFGTVYLDQVEIPQMESDEDMIDFLRTNGIKHPEEYVSLHSQVFESYKKLIEQHEFLKEMSSSERDSFFDNLARNYNDLKLDPRIFIKTDTNVSKRPN